jgi:hypothetical protein
VDNAARCFFGEEIFTPKARSARFPKRKRSAIEYVGNFRQIFSNPCYAF